MQWLLFVVITTLAGLFQAIVGFGQALIVTPLTLVFLDKKTVLTSSMILGIVLNSILMRKIKRPLDKSVFSPVLWGSLIGMPIGILILKHLPLNELKILVGILSIIFTVLLVFLNLKIPKTKIILWFTGWLCGILQTSTAMSGPPIVLLLSGINMAKDDVRKMLVTFFLYLSIITIPVFLISDVLSIRGILYGLAAAPFVFLAGIWGNKLSKYLPDRWHKSVALLTICASSIYVISSAIN